MSNYKERLELFENIINHKVEYSIRDFRQLCFKGIPENTHVKATSWKILLNYIPLDDYDKWESIKNEKRKSYYEFVKELIIDPSWEKIINAKKEIVAVEDHPLNEAPTSKWSTYFSELTVLEQIDKDTRRTLPDIGFFQFPIIYNKDVIEENKKLGNVEPFLGIPISKRRSLFSRLEHKIKDDDFGVRSHKMPNTSPTSTSADETEYDLHWEALERILFIYAKLNPGIGYIQGMNEILGPIYYVLANDVGVDQLHAEADTFYLFTNVMSIFRDHFIKNLDSVGSRLRTVKNEMTMENIVKLRPQDEPQSKKQVGKRIVGNDTGIGQSMLRLYKRIELRDREVFVQLRTKKILPAYFAFRWLSVLLTQEFNLPDVIRIWDSIFSDINIDILDDNQPDKRKRDGRFDFLIEFCCAMVLCVRQEIITLSTGDIIKLLQNYPIQDVNTVLQVAYKNFEMPLRLRVTPEQIQKRQEYLKKKYQQQQQQGKTSEVIKNSINTLENKLQSLDFSKMFNQVSEKISSIASPITPDKSFFYFDNDEGGVDHEEVIVKEGNVNRRHENKSLSVATAVAAAKAPPSPKMAATPTTPTSNSLNVNLTPFSSNIRRSRSLLSTSPTTSTKMTMTSTPPFNTDINLKAEDSSSPPLRRNTFSSPRRPVLNGNTQGLQKKSSLSAISTDLNSAYENASNRLSGWFKNAFANINIMINDTPINEVNSNNINGGSGSSSSITRNKRASLPPRINAPSDDIHDRIQRKLAEADDDVPILKSSNASSSSPAAAAAGKKKSIRMVNSSPHLKTPSNMTSDSVKKSPAEAKEGNSVSSTDATTGTGTNSSATLQIPKQS